MKTIAIPQIRFKGERTFFESHSKFVTIARDLGYRLEDIVIEDLPKKNDTSAQNEISNRIIKLINECDAMIFRTDSLLHWHKTALLVQQRIQDGLRALFLPGDYPTHFLEQQYGLRLTQYGIFRTIPFEETDKEHPRVFSIRKSDTPYAFRDPQIFNGVNEVVVSSANLIKMSGDSQTLLVSGHDDIKIVDTDSDFDHEWNSFDLPIMAGTFMRDTSGAAILLSSSIFHNDFKGGMGHYFPGINGNELFATNLLHYLANEKVNTSDYSYTAARILENIERNMADILKAALERIAGPVWWESEVPEDIKDSCHSKAKSEKFILPDRCYIDLIQIKKIYEKRWDVFEEYFRNAGFDGGKKRIEKWLGMSKTLELRKIKAHPTKGHFGGITILKEDIEELEKTEKLIIQLWDSAIGIH